MTAGRDVLHRIDASIAEARRSLGEANRAIGARSSRMAAIERAESDAIRSIASIRLESLRADELSRSLGAADEEAGRLFAKHEGHLADLAAALDSARRGIENLETTRRQSEETLAAAIATHEAAVGQTNQRLEADAEYQNRASALEEANAIAERAASKLDLARANRAEKGAPYEKDPLFSYLWKRQFGTRKYKAFFLFAMLDRWVAGLIRYRRAKLNYARLLELPERLGEHAGRVEQSAAVIETDLETYERAALERDGVGTLRENANTARAALEQTDAAIAAAEERHQKAGKDHASAASGRSGPMEEARQRLALALADRSIPDLKVLAAETTTLADDRLVDELIRFKRERFEIEESGSSIERSLRKQSEVLAGMEKLRRRFKSARYDSPYSEFPDRSVIGVILSELLRGALSENDAWRRLIKGQRQRRRDWAEDFGGGAWRDGFGLPQDMGRNSPRFPGPRGPRPPRIPRAPRIRMPRAPRGRGGFKTGGGF